MCDEEYEPDPYDDDDHFIDDGDEDYAHDMEGSDYDDEDREPDYYDLDDYDESEGGDFADPGGRSALRAATPSNPRNQPCPTCGRPNRLTPKDVALGYQCDTCADQLERGGP